MAQTLQPETPTPSVPESEPYHVQPGRVARLAVSLGVLLVALAYILPGLTGHDPWTADEAYSFGIIHQMVTTGDLVVPTLAGAPVLDDPPAYYIGAAGMVRGLGGWLPMHDAARVTTGVCLALTLLFAGLMGRRAWGPGLGGAAVLALIGSFALIAYGHVMVTDAALTAGMAMGYYGLLRARESVAWGGFWLGTGCGLAFLSKGLFGPGALGVAAVLLLAFNDWRNWGYLRALAVAIVVAMPWLLVWPGELYLRDPELFRTWFLDNNPVQYLGTLVSRPPPQRDFWLRNLPWVTFPLLPFALWTLMRRPRAVFGNPGVRVALTVSVVGWGLLFWVDTARHLYALPLLAPLAVIAAGGLRDLPGWLVGLCYWLSILGFAAIAAVLWGLWAHGLAAGQPPQLPLIGEYLPPDLGPPWNTDAALVALALTLAWILAVKRLSPTRPAGLAAWPLGLTLAWGLTSLLHMSWLDAAGSYRGVFTELRARLPLDAGCVAALVGTDEVASAGDRSGARLWQSQLGLLDYFVGVKPVRADTLGEVTCDWVLVRRGLGLPEEGADLGQGWERVWEGRRPVARSELFMLFRRSEELFPPLPAGVSVAPGTPEAAPAGDQPPEVLEDLDVPGAAAPPTGPEPESLTAPRREQEMVPNG